MSHRHTRQNVDKYKILQMWWGRKRGRKKVKRCNIRIIDRPSFRGKEIQRTLSCVLSTQLFPLCWSLSIFKIVLLILLVKASKSECVSHVWQAAKSGDICITCDMSLSDFCSGSKCSSDSGVCFYFLSVIRNLIYFLFPFSFIKVLKDLCRYDTQS